MNLRIQQRWWISVLWSLPAVFVSKNLSLKDLIWCLFLVFFGVVLTDGQRCAKDGQFLHLISFFNTFFPWLPLWNYRRRIFVWWFNYGESSPLRMRIWVDTVEIRTSRSKFSAPSWCLCLRPENRGSVFAMFFETSVDWVDVSTRMGWGWGGVVMLTFLAHMFLHLHTWSCGWGGGVAMLTFPAKYSIPPSLHTLLGNDEVNPKTFVVQKVAGELHSW